MPKLLVAQLYDRMKEVLKLELLGSPAGLEREITSTDASGPGLVLAGYTGRYVAARIQVLGETEVSVRLHAEVIASVTVEVVAE